MLSENIKRMRKGKGMPQEELAEQLHVVRQTVSKWEKGLSVPDSEMLVRLADALETTVSALLDETPAPTQNDPTLQDLADKLECLNARFARQATRRRRIGGGVLIALTVLVAAHLAAYLWVSFQLTASIDAGVSMIGGADGPTSILVSTAPLGGNPFVIVLDALLLVGGIVGIIKTK